MNDFSFRSAFVHVHGSRIFSKDKTTTATTKTVFVIVRPFHRLVRIHRGFEKLRFRFLHQVVGAQPATCNVQPGIPVTDRSQFFSVDVTIRVFGVLACSGEDRE